MANPDIAEAFQGPEKATYANTVMVGGVGMDGQVDCYWSELANSSEPVLYSEAWRLCTRENRLNCTVLADRGRVLIKEPGSPAISPSYELFGKFAQAYAAKRHEGGAAPGPGTLRCSSPIVGVLGDPTYVCQ
ncbi:MAG: hypothetical protein EPO08_00450 [Rhodospirillaceae bacterium]|nr:MAG: hypothetical protein EPO08_00450 [Rhodospirillaceae bacterium]